MKIMKSIDAIDAVLAESKRFAGNPNWREDPSSDGRALIVVPLMVNGSVVPGLEIRGNATVRLQKQCVNLVLVGGDDPIQRLTVYPKKDHVNSFRSGLPQHLRGMRLPAGQTRFYPWQLNRRWPRQRQPRERVDGLLVDTSMSDFDAAMLFFLDACNVDGVIPPPPYRPELF